MKFHRKALHIFFFLLFLGNIFFDIYLYTLPSRTTIWHYLFNATYGCVFLIGSIVSILYAMVFSVKTTLGKMLLLFGIGLLCYATGQAIWVYYNLVLKVVIPYPSVADIVFIAYYPIMGIGGFFLFRLYQSLIPKTIIRDSIIIVIVAAVTIFGILYRPDLSPTLSLPQKLVNIGYSTGDVIILSIALLALRIGGKKIHPSLIIFSIGLFFMITADALFNFRTSHSIYWNGDIADLFYTLGGYVTSIGLFEAINSLNHALIKPVTTPSSKYTVLTTQSNTVSSL